MSIVSSILIIIGFLILLLGIICLFKPIFLDDKNKPNQKQGTRGDALGMIVFSFLILMVGGWLAPEPSQNEAKIESKVETKETAKTPTSSGKKSEEPTKITDSANHEQDLKKFVEYHKKINVPFNEMEKTYATLKKQLSGLKKQSDLAIAYQIADELDIQATQMMSSAGSVKLDDEKANESAKKYSTNVGTVAYGYQRIAKIAKDVTNGDSQMKPSEQLEYKKLIDGQQTTVINLVVNLFSTYEALGIKSEQIDTKNGGIK